MNTTTSRHTASTSRHRRTAAATLLVAVGAIAFSALGSAASANADVDKYVAIAYLPATGAHGWENNETALSWAKDSAEVNCLHYTDYRSGSCVVAVWAKNGCAALAVDGDRWHGAYGPNLAAAENAALANNGGGHIVLSRCSEGGAGTGT